MLRIHLPIMERDKKGELKRGEASLTKPIPPLL
jgi:hypothetical protein